MIIKYTKYRGVFDLGGEKHIVEVSALDKKLSLAKSKMLIKLAEKTHIPYRKLVTCFPVGSPTYRLYSLCGE